MLILAFILVFFIYLLFLSCFYFCFDYKTIYLRLPLLFIQKCLIIGVIIREIGIYNIIVIIILITNIEYILNIKYISVFDFKGIVFTFVQMIENNHNIIKIFNHINCICLNWMQWNIELSVKN